MAHAAQLPSDFARFATIIRAAIEPVQPFSAESESATAMQVDRGIVYASALIDPAHFDQTPALRLIELSNSERLGSTAIIDRNGHHRGVYRALLVYSWLQAFSIAYEMLPRSDFGRWEEGIRPWCDLLESELGVINWPNAGHMPAALGSSATESAWMALALHIAGKVYVRDAWTDLASDTFGKLARSQSESGAFLTAGASDNPETHWYHELVLLHAAASYAVQTEDRHVATAVAKSTEFHQRETQPDHATNQPWALFAFIWNPTTRPLAEQLLHSASVLNSESRAAASGISLMLLADALYCLNLFLK